MAIETQRLDHGDRHEDHVVKHEAKREGGLVLRRRRGEEVQVEIAGQVLRVQVLGFQGRHVRLRFVGSPAFVIRRGELAQAEA